MDGDATYFVWAVGLGILSSVSLPLGAAAGLALRPPPTVTASLAAFGAGALIAALAVELVAPTVSAIGEHGGGVGAFWALVIGAACGGLVFVGLDKILSERGGFLRKVSTTISHHTRRKRATRIAWLHDLCAIPLLRALPAEQVDRMLDDVTALSFAEGDTLFTEGDDASCLYFIRSGRVDLTRQGSTLDVARVGGILGEVALVAQVPRRVTARAVESGEALVLRREALERWRAASPEFDAGVRQLAAARLAEIRQRDAEIGAEEETWARSAIAALDSGAEVPTAREVRAMAEEHDGAGLAVWLGMLIDGVPESIVIGAGFLSLLGGSLAASGEVAFADVVPYTLVAGLFLSNFPEALSSSIAMQSQGWRARSVLGLWMVLVAVTAVGAGVGYWIGESVSHTALAGVEGLAAGAMLTAIASTMIPEAVHLAGSGSRVGLATLAGFLSAVSFKLLE